MNMSLFDDAVRRAQFDQRCLQAVLRNDPVSFIQKVLETVRPADPYLDNWHIWVIAWHLELVRLGRIKRLIICAPPRSLKSIITSVSFSAFVLGHDPTAKIVSVTYGNKLATTLTNQFRKVITAPWYQQTFPATRISKGRDTEFESDFTAGGYRLSTTIAGSLTGRGGNIIICDDPNKGQDITSDLRLAAANEAFRNTIYSRLDDKRTGAIVVVMQRLHPNDFVGSILESSEDWVVLKFPAIAEVDERYEYGPGLYYYRKAGEPLHAAREPLAVLEGIRRDCGSAVWAAQQQQEPIPFGGNIIKKDDFRYHVLKDVKRDYRHRIIQSWDTAGKIGPRNSFSVCTTWLVADGNYYLLDMVRGRFDLASLTATAIEAAKKWNPSEILVEDASSGPHLAEALKKSRLHQVRLVPVVLDKVTRLWNQAPKFQAGRVFLPKDAPFLAQVEKELLSFPKGQTNDIVDSISQALAYEGPSYTLEFIR